ncbi:MAG: hypothetical protein WKF58_17425 [Ilumatobacteraceae bacterium]
MLGGVEPEVRCLDPQAGVVRQHRRRSALGLTQGSTDDAVVGDRLVEAVLAQHDVAGCR